MSRAAEQSNSVLVEHVAEQAHPKPELLQTAAARKAAAPQAGSSVLGWITSKARSVGGIIASPGAGTLIFTSVCLVLAYQHKKSRAKAEQPVAPAQPVARSLSRTVSFAMLQSGRKAMERFLMISSAAAADEAELTKRASEALENIRNELREESDQKESTLQKKQLDFQNLHVQIGILEMSDKDEEAIEVLKKALDKMKGPSHTHDAHEIELLLVEMLVFKGEHEKALSYRCLSVEDAVSPADPRVPLYKTIIYCLKKDENKAKENYEKLKRIRDEFHSSKVYKDDPSVYFEVPEFQKFKEIVKNIEEEIKRHKPKKPLQTTGTKEKTAAPEPSKTEAGKEAEKQKATSAEKQEQPRP